MSEERCAGIGSRFACHLLKSLLLAAALVFAVAPPRPGVAAAAQTSSDGSAEVIAFDAGGEIYVTDASGGTPTKIVAAKAGVTNMQPALSPDGSRIAFSSNVEGQFRIYVVGVDGGGVRRLTHSTHDDSEPAWSPDGARIAFVRGFDATGNGVFVQTCADWSDILVVDVDAEPHTVVNLTSGSRGTDPAWSPDGKRIAFASDREGDGSFHIYVMSSEDGSDVHQLTHNDWADADPAWSPDGALIAYTAALRTIGGTQCGNMPISGSPTGGGGPHFSGGGGPYIYTMNADGKSSKPLTEGGGAAGPSWSPDGSQVIFTGGSDDSEDVQLYMTTSALGGQKWAQLTVGEAKKSSPSWARTLGR